MKAKDRGIRLTVIIFFQIFPFITVKNLLLLDLYLYSYCFILLCNQCNNLFIFSCLLSLKKWGGCESFLHHALLTQLFMLYSMKYKSVDYYVSQVYHLE